ncbi:hypothetical protein BpHYR1_040474, partial [Brachionus plicatilis]
RKRKGRGKEEERKRKGRVKEEERKRKGRGKEEERKRKGKENDEFKSHGQIKIKINRQLNVHFTIKKGSIYKEIALVPVESSDTIHHKCYILTSPFKSIKTVKTIFFYITPATSKPTAKPTRKRKQTQVTENTDEISNKKPKIGENQLKEDVVDLAIINTTTTSYTSFFLNVT